MRAAALALSSSRASLARRLASPVKARMRSRRNGVTSRPRTPSVVEGGTESCIVHFSGEFVVGGNRVGDDEPARKTERFDHLADRAVKDADRGWDRSHRPHRRFHRLRHTEAMRLRKTVRHERGLESDHGPALGRGCNDLMVDDEMIDLCGHVDRSSA